MSEKSEKIELHFIPSLSTKMQLMVTVGISTNTRLLGLAVIKQNALLDYSIHLNKSSWSPTKANLILASLEPCVSRYCIKKVILSIPYVHHQTKAFQSLIHRIRDFFQAKGIPVFAEPPEALHSLYATSQKKTKKELMKFLVSQFPELTYCHQKEIRNKNRYYYKLFEAVAVAKLHQ